MPESQTCENWLDLVNIYVCFAHQIRKIYQVLSYSVDFKAPTYLLRPLHGPDCFTDKFGISRSSVIHIVLQDMYQKRKKTQTNSNSLIDK